MYREPHWPRYTITAGAQLVVRRDVLAQGPVVLSGQLLEAAVEGSPGAASGSPLRRSTGYFFEELVSNCRTTYPFCSICTPWLHNHPDGCTDWPEKQALSKCDRCCNCRKFWPMCRPQSISGAAFFWIPKLPRFTRTRHFNSWKNYEIALIFTHF